jgi:hypothetical protein
VLAVRYGDPPDPPAVTVLMDALRTVAVPSPRGADGGAGPRADSPAAEPAQVKPSG